jgi:hypothetical protein
LIPLAVLCVLLLGALIYYIRTAQAERETYLKAIELFVTEGRKERQELANRIQRPESTPIYDTSDEPQSITYDSDAEFWAYKEDAAS